MNIGGLEFTGAVVAAETVVDSFLLGVVTEGKSTSEEDVNVGSGCLATDADGLDLTLSLKSYK